MSEAAYSSLVSGTKASGLAIGIWIGGGLIRGTLGFVLSVAFSACWAGGADADREDTMSTTRTSSGFLVNSAAPSVINTRKISRLMAIASPSPEPRRVAVVASQAGALR